MTRRAPPLYLELRKTLADELAAGKYPVGSRFPTELELCERYVAEPYIGIRAKVDHAQTPIYALLSEQYGLSIDRVERQIRAIAMPADVSGVLATRANTPALLERRTYFGNGSEVFEITLSIYPGDRFAHTTQLVREAVPGPKL